MSIQIQLNWVGLMRNDLQMTMSVLHIDLPVSVCLNVLVKLRELLKSNLLDQQVFKIDDIIIFLGYCVTRYPATRLWAVDVSKFKNNFLALLTLIL